MNDVGFSAKEDGALLEASFEPLEEDRLLWEKDGVCYGRQAALQKALGKLYEEEGTYLFNIN
jgi:hypothetical protein